MTSSDPEPTPDAAVDRERPRRADAAVAVGTLLYLVCLLVPWFSVDGADLGGGYVLPPVSANGFDSGLLVAALVALVLASVWALLPALVDVPVRFPRPFLTAGLTAPAAVLTVMEWLSTTGAGFTVAGLLAAVVSVAVLGVAVLRLLPEVVAGPLPGRLGRAVQWANRALSRPGRRWRE